MARESFGGALWLVVWFEGFFCFVRARWTEWIYAQWVGLLCDAMRRFMLDEGGFAKVREVGARDEVA